jgi:hypothetical protein
MSSARVALKGLDMSAWRIRFSSGSPDLPLVEVSKRAGGGAARRRPLARGQRTRWSPFQSYGFVAVRRALVGAVQRRRFTGGASGSAASAAA